MLTPEEADFINAISKVAAINHLDLNAAISSISQTWYRTNKPMFCVLIAAAASGNVRIKQLLMQLTVADVTAVRIDDYLQNTAESKNFWINVAAIEPETALFSKILQSLVTSDSSAIKIRHLDRFLAANIAANNCLQLKFTTVLAVFAKSLENLNINLGFMPLFASMQAKNKIQKPIDLSSPNTQAVHGNKNS